MNLADVAVLALPGLVATAAGIVRWRTWRQGRRAWRRTPPYARVVFALLAIGGLAACHSIERGVYAHGPVPLADLPFNEPIVYSVGPNAGQQVPAQNGLLGSYFNGADYVQPAYHEYLDHQQIDPNVDFIWDGSDTNPVIPAGHGGIDVSEGDPRLPDHWPIWSVVWEGYLDVPADGRYAFRLHVNNGGWLEMKNTSGALTTVISCPGGSGFEGDCFGGATLNVGRAYVRISYYNNAPSAANAIFSWQRPGDAGYSVVPTESLFTQAESAPVSVIGDELGASFGYDPITGVLIAEPVNTDTGNLTMSAVDLAIPGRGPPLRLVRSYNSRDTSSGIFGQGWSSDLGWSVQTRPSGDAVLVRPDGRRDVYHRNADGTYSAPSGVFDALAARSTGGFTLTTVDQRTLLFGSDGLLSSYADRNGTALSYVFTADAKHVAQISADGGRTLSFEYDAGGHLTRASDSAGRQVVYAYSSGELVTLTDATGATTRYAYDPKGHLTQVTDPLGNVVLTNVYDSDGRVTTQTDAVGGVVRFSYDNASRVTTHTDARGNATKIAHDAQGRTIAVTDPTGKSIAYTYDARGNKASFRDRNGNTWKFAYDARGNRSGATDPAGGIASFTYDAQNDLLSRTDPNGNAWHYAYDARGDLTSITDPEGGATQIVVDASGLPTTVTDADGVAVSYAYDAAGNATSVTTAAGTAHTAYDAAGRPVSRTDANGHVTTFRYDARDRLIGMTDATGNASSLRYDLAGNLVSVTDRRGGTTSLTYDAASRLVATHDPLANATAFAYDANGSRTAITDPLGKRLGFAYDALDRLASVTDAEGGTTSFAYDANGNLTAATDPRGNVARHSYDFRNLRTATTDRTGAITRFTYDAAGRLISTADPTSATTRFAYDRTGRLTATTDALSAVTGISYTGAGRRASVVDALGGRTALAYDAAGRLVSVTDPVGGIVRFGYDGAGNLITSTDQLGHVTHSAYDALDRLAQVTDALGGITQRSYDAEGALASVRDASGGLTAYSYDAAGRLVAVTDALGGITRYAYDARGLLIRTTDANGHSRTFDYDGARRLVRETDALGRSRATTYDRSGNAATVTDALGQVTTLGYDPEDRLVSLAYADGQVVRIARDARGDRASMTDGLGTTAYTYDALRRLTATTDPFGKTVRSGYDALGRRTQLTYPDGALATFGYDAASRLVDVAQGTQRSRFGYDAASALVSADLASGTTMRAAVDALGRTTALDQRDAKGDPIASFAYTYDPLGNITSETARGKDEDERTSLLYRYDALSRLVAVSGKGDDRSATFGYDAVGDRTSVSRGDGKGDGDQAATATFDAADQLTAILTGNGKVRATFDYDPNGSLIRRTGSADDAGDVTRYRYDAARRLVSVAGPDRQSASFRYDGDGALYEERRTGDDAADDHSRSAPDALRYTLDLAAPLASVLAASTSRDSERYLYGPAGRLSATGAKDTLTYHADVRQSVRALSDERGRTKATFGYDAWGTPDHGDRQGDGRTSLASLFGFTGERQAQSGLTFLHARWYDPGLGRFLSRDPVAGSSLDPRTQNPYAYALNDPTSKVDHSGFSAADLFNGDQGYSYDGTNFYNDPAAQPAAGLRAFGRNAAYAIAGTFADLDSPDPGTKVAALAKVGLAGVAIAAPIALALPEEAVAGGAAVITGVASTVANSVAAAGTAIAGGVAGFFQKAQSLFANAPRPATAVARDLGREGEVQAGIEQAAKVRIPSLTNTAAYRIPDELTATTLREVKNVKHLGLTAQLQDFIAYAQQTGRQVILEVRENTAISRGLQSLADQPESQILILRSLLAR